MHLLNLLDVYEDRCVCPEVLLPLESVRNYSRSPSVRLYFSGASRSFHSAFPLSPDRRSGAKSPPTRLPDGGRRCVSEMRFLCNSLEHIAANNVLI